MGTHQHFGSASAPNFIATVLPAFYSVAQISVTVPNPVSWGPKDVTVDGSNDGGVTWTTSFWAVFGVWSDGQTQTLGTGCPPTSQQLMRPPGECILCAGQPVPSVCGLPVRPHTKTARKNGGPRHPAVIWSRPLSRPLAHDTGLGT